MDRPQTSFDRDPLAPLRVSNAPLSLAELKAASTLPKTRSMNFRIGVVAAGILSAAAIALINTSNNNHHVALPVHAVYVPQQASMSTTLRTEVVKTKAATLVADRSKNIETSASAIVHREGIVNVEHRKQDEQQRSPLPEVSSKSQSNTSSTVVRTLDSTNVRYIPHELAKRSKDIVYGSLQYGTIMGALNTAGGGVAVTAAHDWMQATLRYTSTFGVASKDIFAQPINKTSNQDVREYAMMFGARLEQNDFWASIEAGPNIIHATFNTYITYPQADTLSNTIGGGLGASAEATFGYKFNDHVGVDLTGFVSNHSITYGGVLLSVAVGEF